MEPRFLIVLIMGGVLMVWVVFCGVQFIRHGRREAQNLNLTAHVKCETCGTEYPVITAELARSFFAKSKSTARTRIAGAAFVNTPKYSYYAKRLDCPHCGRKQYAQVLNIDELNEQMTMPVVRTGIRWLLMMLMGGILIFAVTSAAMFFADKASRNRAEEMRQQRYEELRERYQ